MSRLLSLRLGSQGDLCLQFRVLDTPVADLWLERMSLRKQWPLDHPNRFYGFGTAADERRAAQALVEQCVRTINAHEPIIDRPFDWTQDCLNYLHNVFERYHGLLDQQTHDWWQAAPQPVRQALATLNLAVHRCESVLNTNPARLVCTWFGMPKTHTLSHRLQQQHGTTKIEFGTVYLNYCEIGKTLEDLSHDNDAYIADEAFRPFGHYSADFWVAFHSGDLASKLPAMQNFMEQHKHFFLAHGIESVYNVQAMPLRFPVAKLQCTSSPTQLIAAIASRQWVHSVELE